MDNKYNEFSLLIHDNKENIKIYAYYGKNLLK